MLTWVPYAGWEAAVFGEWVRLGGGMRLMRAVWTDACV